MERVFRQVARQGSPAHIAAVRICTIRPVEIDTPSAIDPDTGGRQNGNRNPPFGCPNVARSVDPGCVLKARVPVRIVEWMLLEIDFQIEPLIVWSDLEL